MNIILQIMKIIMVVSLKKVLWDLLYQWVWISLVCVLLSLGTNVVWLLSHDVVVVVSSLKLQLQLLNDHLTSLLSFCCFLIIWYLFKCYYWFLIGRHLLEGCYWSLFFRHLFEGCQDPVPSHCWVESGPLIYPQCGSKQLVSA